MKKNIFYLLPLMFVFSACSIYHVNSEDTATDFYPSKISADQVVYMEKIDRPHEIIGYITVNTERIQPMNEVIEQMKREAAILGADAITDIHTDANGVWKKLPAQKFLSNGYVRANFRAAAVVFK